MLVSSTSQDAVKSADNHIGITRVQLSQDEIAAVVEVLRSDNLVAEGVVQGFEHQFAKQVGASYAVAVSSGTARYTLHTSRSCNRVMRY